MEFTIRKMLPDDIPHVQRVAKTSLLIMTLVFFLAGCGMKIILFSGESDSWKGEYVANVDDTSEDGQYTFYFKNVQKEPSLTNLVFTINDGQLQQTVDIHQGATVHISSSCSGCAVTSTNKPIKVHVNWDHNNEETFFLEPVK